MGIKAKISGIENLRYKESNRIEGLVNQLKDNGSSISVSNNEVDFGGSKLSYSKDYTFKSLNDHRIIMALAPLASLYDKIQINETSTVKKSFPDFFNEISKLGFLRNKIIVS
jgi:3-phosphoshikimate 1-carboxyvinyltransferase